MAPPGKDFYFDGQRWMPRTGPASRRGPKEVEEFCIADDDDEDDVPEASNEGASKASAVGGKHGITLPRPRTIVALSALALVLLFVLAQFTLVAPLLPAAGDGPNGSEEELVRWQGLEPTCPGLRFRVAPGHVVKLREGPKRDSAEVAAVAPGAVARRLGPCQNEAGLVRVLLAFPANATMQHGSRPAEGPGAGAQPAGASEGTGDGGVGGGEVRGWATLTAEFVRGPRFFEPLEE
mmetsp:Transcript_6414/g.15805  ORF Transcript_6414/g.15805 Transcript_6414/m.15805 type:complete len:236 (+) Transcript_6414:161-868(+)